MNDTVTSDKKLMSAIINAAEEAGYGADGVAFIGLRLASATVSAYRDIVAKILAEDDPNYNVLKSVCDEADDAINAALTFLYIRLRATVETAMIAKILKDDDRINGSPGGVHNDIETLRMAGKFDADEIVKFLVERLDESERKRCVYNFGSPYLCAYRLVGLREALRGRPDLVDTPGEPDIRLDVGKDVTERILRIHLLAEKELEESVRRLLPEEYCDR